MKCPSCGAEIRPGSSICDSCGSQIPYEMKRQQEQLSKQGCPSCGSSNIQFRRENQGEIRGKKSKQVVHRTVGFCKDCGYTWYPQGSGPASQNNNLLWWILGWLFFFPAPVMVLIWRKKNKWDIKIKIAVTVVFWLLIFLIGACSNSSDPSSQANAPAVENNIAVETADISDNVDAESDYAIIDAFIDQYNAAAENKLTDPVEIDIQDKEHYRTEYRLNAYKKAVAKQCTVSGCKMDIVNYGGLSNSDIRFYLNTDDENLAVSVFNAAAKVLDPTITEDDLAKADDEIIKGTSGGTTGHVSFYFLDDLFVDAKADFYNK